ncbi:MAG: NAD(P)-dependent alcohol dehydrogenase [Anaerolineaceae bacterium]|nr:NAD(P)-dependent alcohol dehydrogenase [Anaerolineaceae bacterium]
MKAVIYTDYGSPEVLKLAEMEKPTPKADEILIKIHATTVKTGDIWARNFKAISPSQFSMPFLLWLLTRLEFGVNKPKKKILGAEFSGEVEAVGSNVTRFKKGDLVFGYRGAAFGANASYLCMSEKGLVTIKPDNMSHAEAATVPYGAVTAFNLLRKANLKPGQKILINGASGGIGSFALQLAKTYGVEVTGVCSKPRMEMVKSLGADYAIDYTKEDFTRNGKTYDVILDILGKSSFSRCQHSLTENGIYLLASFKMLQLWQMLKTSMRGGKKVVCAMSMESSADLEQIKEMVEIGKIKTIIDKQFPIHQTADAHRYIEAGKMVGNVVIMVA